MSVTTFKLHFLILQFMLERGFAPEPQGGKRLEDQSDDSKTFAPS